MLSPSLGSRVNSTKHLLFLIAKRGKQIPLPQCGIGMAWMRPLQ